MGQAAVAAEANGLVVSQAGVAAADARSAFASVGAAVGASEMMPDAGATEVCWVSSADDGFAMVAVVGLGDGGSRRAEHRVLAAVAS